MATIAAIAALLLLLPLIPYKDRYSVSGSLTIVAYRLSPNLCHRQGPTNPPPTYRTSILTLLLLRRCVSAAQKSTTCFLFGFWVVGLPSSGLLTPGDISAYCANPLPAPVGLHSSGLLTPGDIPAYCAYPLPAFVGLHSWLAHSRRPTSLLCLPTACSFWA